MTLTPHDSIDIIERIIKSYRYDYEKEIDNEDEEPSPLTVLMDIKQILHNTLAPKWAKITELDEHNTPSFQIAHNKKMDIKKGA